MDQAAIADYLYKHYELGGRASLKIISDNYYNNNYRVEAGGQSYFLKIGKILPLANVVEESSILASLADLGFPAVPPIKDRDGSFASCPDFAENLRLYPFVVGRSVAVGHSQLPHLSEAKAAAELLSRLHQLTSGQDIWQRTHRTGLTEIDRALGSAALLRHALREADDFLSELAQARNDFKSLAGDFSLVHGDWRSKNLIYQPAGDEIKTVLDFEWSFYGPRWYDLGLMLVEWSYPDGGDGFDQEIISGIISAYFKNSGRSGRLDDNLKFWMYYAALCDAATYFLGIAPGQPIKSLTDSYMYQKALAVKRL
ncbi:MAG: phosphotransferase [Patescibacteria group bacterium]